MGKPRQLNLTETQQSELIRLRDTASKPYLRERAAALLKIADGDTAAYVARAGLLRQRDPDTIYDWLNRFEQGGIGGLLVRVGRGRKPAFSPSVADSWDCTGGSFADSAHWSSHFRVLPNPLDLSCHQQCL